MHMPSDIAARIDLTVKPGSKQPGFNSVAGTIELRVRERAVEGAANAACIRALADRLGVAPSRITLVRGQTSRRKTFSIAGIAESDARARLREP